MASPLVDAIEFMKSFGIFDVVLPFLLVFTVIFGILEKTKVFGTEGKDGPARKNLDAMVAFVIGFFVVAAAQIVGIMQKALPVITLILILIIAFMILYGATLGEGQIDIWTHIGKGKGIFAFGLVIAIIAIVLGAMDMLGGLVDWINQSLGGPALTTTIMLLVIGIFMWIVLKDKKETSGKTG